MKRCYQLSPDQIASFRTALAAHDIDCPPGNSGVLKPGWGVKLQLDYNGVDTLTITILSVGWGDAPGIWAKIQQYMPVN